MLSKLRKLLPFPLIFTLVLMFSACAGNNDQENQDNENNDENVTEEENPAANEVSETESALRTAQQDGQVHSLVVKIQDVVRFSQGIFGTFEAFGKPPLASINDLMNIAFGNAAISSGAMVTTDIGDSGVTEDGNEWIILAENFDEESGIYTVSIKVTFNDVNDPHDFTIFNYTIDTRKTREHEDDILTGYGADESFRDGMVGHVHTRDLDEDGNLLTGLLLVAEDLSRIGNHPEVVYTAHGHVIEINDPNTREDDLVLKIGRDTLFTNDVKVEERLTPVPPVAPQTEIRSGVYNALVTFPEGDLQTYRKDVTFNEDGSGQVNEEWLFTDGSSSVRQTNYDGQGHVVVEGKDRNGTTYKAQFDFNTGRWNKVITPAAESDTNVAQIEESGEVHFDDQGNGQGQIFHKVTFKDGSVFEDNTKFAKEGNKIRSHTENNSGGVGDLLLTLNPASVSLEGRWTDGEGVATDYVELIYSDHTANLLSISDDPTTSVEPDVESDINFAADGSGIGLIEVNKRSRSYTFRVLFNADGTGTVIDEAGTHHLFGY